VNHTCFPKEDNLPECARRDNKVTKDDYVEILIKLEFFSHIFEKSSSKIPWKSRQWDPILFQADRNNQSNGRFLAREERA